jgi:hypothetical protein
MWSRFAVGPGSLIFTTQQGRHRQVAEFAELGEIVSQIAASGASFARRDLLPASALTPIESAWNSQLRVLLGGTETWATAMKKIAADPEDKC